MRVMHVDQDECTADDHISRISRDQYAMKDGPNPYVNYISSFTQPDPDCTEGNIEKAH